MSSETIKTVRVFFSWQSDLSSKTNTGYIRSALKQAAADLEEAYLEGSSGQLIFEIEEATSNLPGSPDIKESIVKKIRACDIFIADASLVHETSNGNRHFPNPNVTFELGFAAALLGWDRIILVVNTAYGAVTSLPFDFKQHRALAYSRSESDPKSGDLKATMKVALETIVKAWPAKGFSDFDPEKTGRERDLNALTTFLSYVHFPSLDQHVMSSAKLLSGIVLTLEECVSELIQSSTFHINDEELRDAISAFATEWSRSTDGWSYSKTLGSDSYHYERHSRISFKGKNNAEFMKQQAEEDVELERLENSRASLRVLMAKLLAKIRRDYPEVDLQLTSKDALKHYIDGVNSAL